MELRERMELTKDGQVTWANPDIGHNCLACVHCVRHHKDMRLYECLLVKVHTGKSGKPYDARKAIACSKFSAVDTPTSR